MIDTHQHLLYPEQLDYPWVRELPALNGRFGLEEYRVAAEGCGIEAGLLMESDALQSEGEARLFCDFAEAHSHGILGVVAAVRPEEDDFESKLDAISHRRLAGIRRVLHTQPDALSRSAVFRKNVGELGRRGLTFDLCVFQRQMPLALELVRSCPGTTFILDHCGVPDIAGNDAPDGEGFRDWRKAVHALAAEPNVNGKISGLTVYASPEQRCLEALWPYVAEMLDAFGAGRLVWGGDWPVVNLGSGLREWCRLTRELLSCLGGGEMRAVLVDNARRIYSLPS